MIPIRTAKAEAMSTKSRQVPEPTKKGCWILPSRYGPSQEVPTEIILLIVSHTRHEDLQALCYATCVLTFEAAKHHRYDPRQYFQTLTSRPEVILSSMRMNNVVLSGSRAAGLFYPKACKQDSDWDFYCSGGDVAVAKFSYQLANELHAKWEPAQDDSEGDVPLARPGYPRNQIIYSNEFHVLQGRLNGHKLQVMWYRAESRSVFSTILEFHSSIVQCFISGWCAASLYHNISREDKMVAWEIDGSIHPRKRAKAPQCVAKYQYRGFQLVPYERKLVGLSESEPDLQRESPSFAEREMPQSMRDNGCLLIDFQPYLPSPSSLAPPFDLTAGTVLLNPERLPTMHQLHLAALSAIQSLIWSETKDSELKNVRQPYAKSLYASLDRARKEADRWGVAQHLHEEVVSKNGRMLVGVKNRPMTLAGPKFDVSWMPELNGGLHRMMPSNLGDGRSIVTDLDYSPPV